MPDARSLVEGFYERIWNNHELDAVPALLSDDFAFRGSLGAERRGQAGFIEYVDSVHRALGHYRCDILDLVVEGGRAFARMQFSGIHRADFLGYAPTQRPVAWAGAALFDTADGRIRSLWVLGDLQGLVRQLDENAARSS